ncbi:MotA/TolQ/ExbB proton channel family protein [Acidihalobacter prosperus]|uniref:Flagellar motor protein MotA n=1 Tax=Acidihalobacter prosperus TaxID=160660 RepID=A0A1A6C081_9GAMM|nr:MotA/TolQ/ExbB proton channel family protein [Acidihalobacter prosperus]OBS07965.1 flagellar motor protein MotA [Acidihalobacter prosperus]
MQDVYASWHTLQFGGPLIYPLLFLAVLMVAILLDKTYVYWRFTRPSSTLMRLIDNLGESWADLERQVSVSNPHHHFVRFVRVILQNRERPTWWAESRASDEAQSIEQSLARGLWMLETIVTAAPLLGLLGTIYGMIHAFNLFGSHGLVDPKGVTSGVAEALIATAVGLVIAVIALFGYNYFSRLQSRTMDEMERIGTRLLDRARLDAETRGAADEAA